MVKIPTLFSAIVMGVGLLCSPLKESRTNTRPSGAPDGMMAFTCRSQTKIGMAFTVTLPCVTSIETPWKVVSRGNTFTCALTSGPMSRPNIVKIEPRATEPPGPSGGIKLAALTIPRKKIRGSACKRPANSATAQINWSTKTV